LSDPWAGSRTNQVYYRLCEVGIVLARVRHLAGSLD
jgi:hypothetical protein